jgi:hypothetical protein
MLVLLASLLFAPIPEQVNIPVIVDLGGGKFAASLNKETLIISSIDPGKVSEYKIEVSGNMKSVIRSFSRLEDDQIFHYIELKRLKNNNYWVQKIIVTQTEIIPAPKDD